MKSIRRWFAAVLFAAALVLPSASHAANVTPLDRASDAKPCAVGQVKGNTKSMIYHVEGQRDYAKTKKSVKCFVNEVAAKKAGYRKAKR